jgi:hypothetical protein
MDLENLGQTAAELKIAFETLQEQIKNNAKLLSKLTGDTAKGFKPFISNVKNLTDELAKASKQSLSSYKERLQLESKLQQVQKEIVGLTRQREVIASRLSIATRAEKIQLLLLIDNYDELISKSQEIVDNTKKLKEELKPINEYIGTKMFGAFSDIINKIPGLSRFSGPFKEAAEATEKVATKNQLIFGNVKGITKAQLESLKTGKGLTAEFAKQLGITDKQGKLGTLSGTSAALRAKALGITNAVAGASTPLMVGLKSLGPALAKAFGPLYLIFEFLEALKQADKATGNLAKDFNLTYNEAANLRGELIETGNLSGNIALNARSLQESMVAVGKSLGSNAKLNEEDLKTFTELREMAGYTNEELIGMQKMSLAMDKPLKDNVKSFLGVTAALNAQNKLTINEKQLLKEVANTSVAIRLSIGGTAEDLAKAAFRAKQFGINLEQADRISESLLDFESSISNELSAELLTGRDLNLERARLLALNGKVSEASAEILRQVRSSAEFTAMNRIQQEAIAKAVGMSREDLAKSLIEREALARLGDKDKTGLEAYNRLKKQGLSDTQIAAELGNEEYARQLKQQSIQERFNASIEKLKEIFISIAEPVLQIVSPFVDILLPVLSTVSGVVGSIVSIFKGGTEQLTTWQKLIASTLVAFTTIKAITLATTLLQTRSLALRAQDLIIAAQIKAFEIQTAVAKMTGSGAASFGVTAAIGLAAGAAAYAYLSSMKDGEIDYSEGPVVTGGFGSVQLSPKDTGFFNGEKIIAGTNLGGKENSQQQDNSILINKIEALILAINNLNNRPIHVGIDVDGQKLAAAVAQYPTTFNTNFNRKAVKA